MDDTQICSRNTPGGTFAQVVPMLASLSASSLLSLPTCRSSQQSNSPSSALYSARYAIMFSACASHSFIVLLYDKVGVTVDDQARCAPYFCHLHAMDEGFVFSLVVGGSEFHPKDVLHLVTLRGGQYDSYPCSGFAFGAVEMHCPGL